MSRFLKFNLLEVFFDDYVRTARAKGLNETVVYRHALRNAMLPVVTILASSSPACSAAPSSSSRSSVAGRWGLMIDGISNRDYAVVQGGLLLLVRLFIVINLLVTSPAR